MGVSVYNFVAIYWFLFEYVLYCVLMEENRDWSAATRNSGTDWAGMSRVWSLQFSHLPRQLNGVTWSLLKWLVGTGSEMVARLHSHIYGDMNMNEGGNIKGQVWPPSRWVRCWMWGGWTHTYSYLANRVLRQSSSWAILSSCTLRPTFCWEK